VISWFQAFPCECNLHRYNVGLHDSQDSCPEMTAAMNQGGLFGFSMTNDWRVMLEEPRYDYLDYGVGSWAAASDMVRFGRLFTFAQKTVGVLRAIPDAGDETREYEFRADDFVGPHAYTCLHLDHVRYNSTARTTPVKIGRA
jgi:hypothetical protein